MFNIVSKEFQFGDQTVTLETGKVARQATGSVTVTAGKNQVLATVVAKREADPSRDFFPLTVNYQEKYYAAGRIPGGFNKREGRPSERETLTCRLIDRPIRPLFPKGFKNDVQIVLTVMSTDKTQDMEVLSIIGAAAALAVAGVPFNGPLAAARVGLVDGMYVLNPNYETLKNSDLELVVAGTESAVLMVESEAKSLTEDQMLGAVLFGHQELQVAIEAIKALTAEVNPTQWVWTPAATNEALQDAVQSNFGSEIAAAYSVTEKMARYEKLGDIRSRAVAQLFGEGATDPTVDDVKAMFSSIEKRVVRESILDGKPRIDGRNLSTVRPISVEVGVLPAVHGSALFTRGETQAIVACTLGSMKSGQLIDSIEGISTDNFMLHYNFPPYCVGETGMMGNPKRREIGHGRLARRGVQATIPDAEGFPFTIRLVSEITESNGSSSMASVCGSSMALMDAGVPVSAPVAGIAMGLVKDGERFAVLSDILGDEDHLGDMDFKVAGSAQGVTALQMDIKIEGITEEIMEAALIQAREGRLHILGEMSKAISEPRPELSENAPTYVTIKINADKIRDVIGKGGATIRALTESTGASIDIEDTGHIKIYGEDKSVTDAAVREIEAITAEPEIDTIYEGKVVRIVDFGAFVNIMPGTDGLVHISQIAEERVANVTDYLSEGQMVKVKVLDIDNRGRIKLSIKEANAEAAAAE